MRIQKSTDSLHFSIQVTALILIALMFLLFIYGCESAVVQDEGEFTAFTNVTVIPMDTDDESIQESQTVIVSDGVIERIGDSDDIDLPGNATVIDGNGRFLIPGLAEMHGHVPGPDDPQYLEDVLFLYLSNGVTTVRNMSGHPIHLELRERLNRGEVTGPLFFTASPWLGGDRVTDTETVDRVVREFQEDGFDLLKIGSMEREVYDQMAETAHETGIPFAGHIPESVGLTRALEVEQESIDHYDRYVEFMAEEHPDYAQRDPGFFGSGVVDLVDESRLSEAIEMTIDAGTWNVPTLSIVEHLAIPDDPEEMAAWDEMKYLPQDLVQGWVDSKRNFLDRYNTDRETAMRLVELRRQITHELHESGAPIVLGSDAPQFFNVPGFSIHREMRMMVDSGLTPYEVLVTGTRNAGIYYEDDATFGTIEEGSLANLILLEANPLEDIGNVRERAGVMIRGEWWPEERIQERLSQIAE